MRQGLSKSALGRREPRRKGKPLTDPACEASGLRSLSQPSRADCLHVGDSGLLAFSAGFETGGVSRRGIQVCDHLGSWTGGWGGAWGPAASAEQTPHHRHSMPSAWASWCPLYRSGN